MQILWNDCGDWCFGFYSVLLRFLVVEEYLEVLYAQFNLQLTQTGFTISDSDKMPIDEFELLIKLFQEKQKEAAKMES